MALAMQLSQNNPEFKTAVAANDSPTINRMIKETLAAIAPDEVKDRVFRLVDGVWRYTDGKQEKVFSDQNIPEDAEAKEGDWQPLQKPEEEPKPEPIDDLAKHAYKCILSQKKVSDQ